MVLVKISMPKVQTAAPLLSAPSTASGPGQKFCSWKERDGRNISSWSEQLHLLDQYLTHWLLHVKRNNQDMKCMEKNKLSERKWCVYIARIWSSWKLGPLPIDFTEETSFSTQLYDHPSFWFLQSEFSPGKKKQIMGLWKHFENIGQN